MSTTLARLAAGRQGGRGGGGFAVAVCCLEGWKEGWKETTTQKP